MQKITPFLWFDHEAEEAANYYVATFKNSRILRVDRYSAEAAQVSGQPLGSVMTVTFELAGQRFVALNGGSIYRINEAVSFLVDCASQQELDAVWQRLTDGGEEIQCGWLKDRFGVTWQIVPSDLDDLLLDPDPVRAGRVWQTMLGMKKLDGDALRRANAGT
jgi:predicted 3-demethylubiquinone-9 3-methyltransferase (glyoxalase superfamily)